MTQIDPQFSVRPGASSDLFALQGAAQSAGETAVQSWTFSLRRGHELDRHAVHRLLSWGLPWAGRDDARSPVTDHGRLLWQRDGQTLLVQAPADLGWSAQAALRGEGARRLKLLEHDSVDPAALLAELQGAQLTLELELSAQVREGDQAGYQLRDEPLRRWTRDQAERAGLALTGAQLIDHGVDRLRRQQGRGLQLPWMRVQWQGELRDAQALARACAFGIGRGRAFGCGMVSLVDAQ